MRYRLKNQALQAALDKATNGAFSELLIDCEGVEIEVNGVKLEIEMDPVKEFDPTKWNEWPGRSFSSYISIGKGDVVRFRPWVGPDEETVG